MNLTPDLLRRRTQQFVLWRPARVNASPRLIIGKYVGSDPPGLEDQREVDLSRDPRFEDVWTLDPADCGLANGVYHYWFEVDSSNPYEPARRVMRPIRPHRTVDWRLLAPASVSPNDASVPAGVILVRDGSLMTCDPGGGEPAWSNDGELAEMPANNRTVIYELPTQWTRAADEHGVEVAAGTFEDVLALVEPASASPNFAHIQALSAGQAHLLTLGVTTLELLPIADSVISLGWKYGTTNYFAPDHTLGLPDGKQVPEPNGDLARLVSTCHSAGIRFFLDAVMGFARQEPYAQINFSDFHVRWLDGRDPNRDPEQDDRNAWGGDLWKYNYSTFGYDPIEGSATTRYPSRQLMQAFIARWILDQRIDGIRIDRVDTIYNWDFVGELRKYGRDLFRARAAGLGVNAGDADARFLIVGEYLSMPRGLVRARVDAMWNDEFKYALRAAQVGEIREGDANFEATVRKIVDCRGRIADYADTAEAINYITSHDVGNYNSMRLFNYLTGPPWYVADAERRIKLAFACLMIAVGVPMIFAGEEFADQHDLPVPTGKETDPVNFARLDSDPWRRRIFDYVCRLVRFRQEAPALGVNDTEFIHIDQTPGRRVFAWVQVIWSE